MARKVLGKISNVPWGALSTDEYDVIIDTLGDNGDSQVVELTDETDEPVLVVTTGNNKRTLNAEATVKGANHFGAHALQGAIITGLESADFPSPFIITSNSASRAKGNFMKCSFSAIYIGDDATEQTLNTSPLNYTSTTTTGTTTTTTTA